MFIIFFGSRFGRIRLALFMKLLIPVIFSSLQFCCIFNYTSFCSSRNKTLVWYCSWRRESVIVICGTTCTAVQWWYNCKCVEREGACNESCKCTIAHDNTTTRSVDMVNNQRLRVHGDGHIPDCPCGSRRTRPHAQAPWVTNWKLYGCTSVCISKQIFIKTCKQHSFTELR